MIKRLMINTCTINTCGKLFSISNDCCDRFISCRITQIIDKDTSNTYCQWRCMEVSAFGRCAGTNINNMKT